MVGPYEKEVKRFLKAADWLTDEHAPMVVHLRTIAKSLDEMLASEGAVQSALANTFGVTWGRLKKPVAKNAPEPDEEDSDLQFS